MSAPELPSLVAVAAGYWTISGQQVGEIVTVAATWPSSPKACPRWRGQENGRFNPLQQKPSKPQTTVKEAVEQVAVVAIATGVLWAGRRSDADSEPVKKCTGMPLL
jgi:hypothetical protein